MYTVRADLVQLVKADAHGIQRVRRKPHSLQHGAENAAVVHVDGEIRKADGQQRPCSHIDQLHLRVGRGIAQNVNIALDKLPQTALLRALRPVDPVGLDDLERVGQLVAVGGVVPGQRQRQVIAQTHIGQRLFIPLLQRRGQLIAPLEHLENQVQVVAAVTLVQILHILQNRRGDALESRGAVGFQNFALNIIPQSLLPRQQVPHSL